MSLSDVLGSWLLLTISHYISNPLFTPARSSHRIISNNFHNGTEQHQHPSHNKPPRTHPAPPNLQTFEQLCPRTRPQSSLQNPPNAQKPSSSSSQSQTNNGFSAVPRFSKAPPRMQRMQWNDERGRRALPIRATHQTSFQNGDYGLSYRSLCHQHICLPVLQLDTIVSRVSRFCMLENKKQVELTNRSYITASKWLLYSTSTISSYISSGNWLILCSDRTG
jgi:hypothetical protein